MNAPNSDLSTLDEDQLKAQVEEWAKVASEGDAPRKVWAAIQAGQRLHELKRRVPYGQFDAAKITEGLSKKTAHRYMSLAERQEVSTKPLSGTMGRMAIQTGF